MLTLKACSALVLFITTIKIIYINACTGTQNSLSGSVFPGWRKFSTQKNIVFIGGVKKMLDTRDSAIKYSILLPYYNRPDQFRKTLQSFVDLYSNRNDFELIIIEDQKQTEKQSLELEEILYEYKRHIFFIWIKSRARNAYNPAQAYNEGAYIARGKYFILTSPECMHVTHILSGFDDEFEKDPEAYVICACHSLKADGSYHMWYQHSEHRNVNYHFCSALLRESYFNRVGGFNEQYTQGYGYDDNSFLLRVQNAGIQIINRDDLLTHHLWHEKVRPATYKELLKRNKDLFEQEQKGIKTHA